MGLASGCPSPGSGLVICLGWTGVHLAGQQCRGESQREPLRSSRHKVSVTAINASSVLAGSDDAGEAYELMLTPRG